MTTPAHPIRFVAEAAELAHLCWRMGWNEANGGNLSWRLPAAEIEAILESMGAGAASGPVAPMPTDLPSLDGDYFLVTGSGQCFRHALDRTDEVFGIVRIVEGGTAWQQVWGFATAAGPTSEFPTHLLAHAVRKRVSNGRERMILHAHTPEFIILSSLVPLDSRSLTRALWQKMPECIVVFPDGVRVVPALQPGTLEIAELSARELEHGRVVSWSHHGIFVSEENPDKAFGLIETIEKAAMMHRKILSVPGPIQIVPSEVLRPLPELWAPHLEARLDWLDDA